uniref:Mitochondrial carrier protein n=1 Tax=Kalanchoe fedtschenkoi TaxID=63787 RepID=A0A7N0TCN4_KALFE
MSEDRLANCLKGGRLKNKTVKGVLNHNPDVTVRNYRILWTGLGAQLARDVPFSGICWSTLEPIRRCVFGLVTDRTSSTSVLGANFCAGFVAGSLAAAVTCPLDVVKTRRQIEKDPSRALKMTTRMTLAEIWRDGGMKGMFTGVGPRVARAGPSVGIVILEHGLSDGGVKISSTRVEASLRVWISKLNEVK